MADERKAADECKTTHDKAGGDVWCLERYPGLGIRLQPLQPNIVLPAAAAAWCEARRDAPTPFMLVANLECRWLWEEERYVTRPQGIELTPQRRGRDPHSEWVVVLPSVLPFSFEVCRDTTRTIILVPSALTNRVTTDPHGLQCAERQALALSLRAVGPDGVPGEHRAHATAVVEAAVRRSLTHLRTHVLGTWVPPKHVLDSRELVGILNDDVDADAFPQPFRQQDGLRLVQDLLLLRMLNPTMHAAPWRAQTWSRGGTTPVTLLVMAHLQQVLAVLAQNVGADALGLDVRAGPRLPGCNVLITTNGMGVAQEAPLDAVTLIWMDYKHMRYFAGVQGVRCELARILPTCFTARLDAGGDVVPSVAPWYGMGTRPPAATPIEAALTTLNTAEYGEWDDDRFLSFMQELDNDFDASMGAV